MSDFFRTFAGSFARKPRAGVLAHLVERDVRNVKVRGSSPLYSTKKRGLEIKARHIRTNH